VIPTLFLLLFQAAPAQSAPANWITVKDAKGLCMISVPPDWTPFSGGTGAAVFHDASTAIAVVTSQPGQVFKALPENIVKLLDLPKDKMFENTAKRVFYQDKTSRNAEDTSAYSMSVPAKGGTCSCRVMFVPSITEEVAKKIAASLAPLEPTQ
jgi:hypothetical protein